MPGQAKKTQNYNNNTQQTRKNNAWLGGKTHNTKTTTKQQTRNTLHGQPTKQ